MRESLQQSSGSPYERPNQPWLCGLEGSACPMGPDGRGHCPAASACHPVRDGDRWRCNRSELRGGMCEEGPSPEGQCCHVYQCKPSRSLRSRRARFVMACMLVTIGGLCVMLSAEWRNEVLAPGDLSMHHAQLVERGEATDRCASCHVAGNQSFGQWLGHALDEDLSQPRQTELCLNCHRKQMASDVARLAHNIPIEQLLSFSSDAQRAEVAGSALSESRRRDPHEPLACSACHKEHHGLQHDLAQMSDTACQACHRQQFESFATDHPPFAQWPWRRRTQIAFDHGTHQSKHFPKEKQEYRCTDCHQSDASGEFQLTLDYDTTCAGCHDEKIAASLAEGVALFNLPMLDVELLQASGHDIGQWPEAATGDFDGALPTVMQMLLVADPQAAAAMARLGPEFDFFDLEVDKANSLQAAAQVAWGIKRLLHEVVEQGHDAVRLRVERLLDRPVPADELEALLSRLSPDTLATVTGRWLPKLSQEMSEAETSEESPAVLRDDKRASGLSDARRVSSAGWYRDERALSIRYRPTGHGDPWIRAWLDVAAEAAAGEHAELIEPLLKRWMLPSALGLCGSCHSVERTTEGRWVIQWQPLDPLSSRDVAQQLTHFSHQPHLLQPQLADCTACHQLDPSAQVMASYAGDDPHVFASGFLPLRKQDCAACHTTRAAGDSCLQCHRYHVDGR